MVTIDLPLVRVLIAIIAVLLIVYSLILRQEKRLVGGLFVSWTLFWAVVAFLSVFWESLNPLWVVLDLSDTLHALFLAVVLLISLMLLRTATISSGATLQLIRLARYSAINEARYQSVRAPANGESKKVAILIPALNAASSLAGVIRRISLDVNYTPLLVVIDDGSTDATARIAFQEGASVVSHPFNIGQGGALKTGFEVAERLEADIAVCLDADGEHHPEEMMSLIKKLEQSNLDMVTGTRFKESRPDLSTSRRVAITMYSWLVRRLTTYDLSDVTCGYRVVRVACLPSLMYRSERAYAIAMLVLAHRAGLRVEEQSVAYTKRTHGHSQFHNLATWARYPFTIVKQLIEIYF